MIFVQGTASTVWTLKECEDRRMKGVEVCLVSQAGHSEKTEAREMRRTRRAVEVSRNCIKWQGSGLPGAISQPWRLLSNEEVSGLACGKIWWRAVLR